MVVQQQKHQEQPPVSVGEEGGREGACVAMVVQQQHLEQTPVHVEKRKRKGW